MWSFKEILNELCMVVIGWIIDIAVSAMGLFKLIKYLKYRSYPRDIVILHQVNNVK